MARMPMRSEELQRPRERAGNRRDPITYGVLREVDVDDFKPDPKWHPIAKMIWDSATTSGQFDYYQNSDMAVLYLICEDLSRYKNGNTRSAKMLEIVMKTLGDLMFTEGDRRRVRLELQKQEPEEQELHEMGKQFFEMIKAEIETVASQEI